MKKMLLIGLGVLLVVIVALGALPFLVDLNQHKQRIISLIEPALGRKVTVEDIQLTVLEGLGAELSGLRIAENPLFGEQDFITLQALKIRVKLRPLLQKRIEVKKIIVDRPVLRIVRNEGGQLNISDLGRRENEEKSGAPGGAGQGPTAPGGALAAGLLVSDCLIRGGEIHILDAGGAGKPIEAVIDRIGLQLQDVSLDRPVRIKMSARLPGAKMKNLHIDGSIGPLQEALQQKVLPPVELALECRNLDLKLLAPWLLPQDGMTLSGGALDVQLTGRGNAVKGLSIQGTATCRQVAVAGKDGSVVTVAGPLKFDLGLRKIDDGAAARGQLDLRQLDIVVGEVFFKPVNTAFAAAFNAKTSSSAVVFENCELTLGEAMLTMTGALKKTAVPELACDFRTNMLAPQDVAALLPALKPLALQGALRVSGSLSGTSEDFVARATVAAPRISLQLPRGEASEKKNGPEPAQAVLEALTCTFLAGKKGDALTGTAALWIETGALPPAAFSDLEARFRYADNLLHIESGRLQAYQGSVALSGTVAPLSKTWELRPVLENLSLEKLLQQLPEAKDNFAGLFSGAFVVKSPVEASAEALPLTTGTFRIDQGVIRNKNIMAAVLDSMFGLKGLAGLIDARAKKLNKYKYTKFDFMEGDFELENQIMQLKKLFIANIQTSKADGAEAEVSGTVRLTDKTLDLKGNLVLSPKHSARLTRRVKALKSLFNAQKRMVLPVRVSGPTEKPRFAVDTRYVMKALRSYYSGKLLKKRDDDEKGGTRETVRQLLEGLLERR